MHKLRKICFWAIASAHVAVPLAGAAWTGAPGYWVISSCAFTAAMVIAMQARSGSFSNALFSLLSSAWMFANLMLAASYYMQDSGFNDAFVYHLDLQSARTALAAYTLPFAGAWCLLGLAAAWPWTRTGQGMSGPTPRIVAGMLLLVALASSAPLHSYREYRSSAPGLQPLVPVVRLDQETSPEQLLKGIPEAGVDSPPMKNILLIYAESLEQAYFDASTFGDLLPEIRKLSGRSQHFTNIYQLPGTHWTIAGIVASQCGFPLVVSDPIASNSTMAAALDPFPKSMCLADVLEENGYQTVFMGGADLAFAGKGRFLSSHGYQEVAGKQELLSQLEDSRYLSPWGLHDDSLFDLAMAKLRALESKDEPWFLTLLTLGMHHPRGIISRSCERLTDIDEPMKNAVFCSDQLISRFVSQAMEMVDMERTIIVLFSDHLSLRNSLSNTLNKMSGERRLTLMLFNDQDGAVLGQSGSHFDVAPTILDAAKVPAGRQLGHGLSLYSPAVADRTGAPQYANYWKVPRALQTSDSILDTGVSVSPENLSLSIGELELEASRTGFEFEYGMFLGVFNEEGEILDAVYSDDFQKLLGRYKGKFVVGISVLEGDPGPTVFLGRLSSNPASLLIRPLVKGIHIEPATLRQWMDR